jgi:hypothetical protein
MHSLEHVFMVKTFLQGMGVQFMEMSFQQDGTSVHTANEILDFLLEYYGNRVILNHFCQHFGYGCFWQSYCLDLSPCEYLLWGSLKANGYRNIPHTVHEMKEEIEADVV